MVGAVYQGDGKMFICMFPEDAGMIATDRPIDVQFFPKDGSQEYDVETLDMDDEDWKKFLRQTDLMETEIITKASDGTLAKAIMRKSQRQIEQGVSWRVFKRDFYKCRYCGKDDIPLTVDHLVVWEEGGPSIEENLVASCRKCNKTRGNTLYPEWLESDFYKIVSRNLTRTVFADNQDLVSTLDKIPRMVHARSR